MAAPIRFFELNTGAKLPCVGLGTYAMVATAIEQAIKVSPSDQTSTLLLCHWI